ncbi:MAG: dihydroxy-acid dehydratase, partial [Candidatus Poribacteria bacterium]|nr:dihydroxy-acid dehydratase [Candidatus Poribacteria bacterium]
EMFTAPTTMMFRNLMAMDTEEMIRAQPMDGVVLLGGCDKTVPAQLMGAVSADLPALSLVAGPMITGDYQGERLGACTDCRRFWRDYRAGALNDQEIGAVEDRLCATTGTCMVMGTASTMAALAEALGIMLPGGAAPPAVMADRRRQAEATGRTIVSMVRKNLRPSQILTPNAFENAIRVLMAIGGSTNAVIHLTAIAKRLGISLGLKRFNILSDETPLLVNVKPSGEFYMEDLWKAGGVPVVMKELEDVLHGDALTALGTTVAENLAAVHHPPEWQEVIRTRELPLAENGGLACLFGNLAPDGAVIKRSAASSRFLTHRGKAVVFNSLADLHSRIDAPDLAVTEDSVIVLQNAGPIGGPGMPEAGYLPIPKKLLRSGVKDMVRMSDARMSGTAFGTVVLHIAPEAAVGGPLALVRDGDMIELDVPRNRLEMLVAEETLAKRRESLVLPEPRFQRGYGKLYIDHIQQANLGCDFDFL